MKSQFFLNRVFWLLDLATGLSREFKPLANGLASLGLLFCSATAGATLQLLVCLTHPQSLHRNSSNSSTLTLSIMTSLRGSFPKSFLTIPTSVRRPFGASEAVRKGPISYWLML